MNHPVPGPNHAADRAHREAGRGLEEKGGEACGLRWRGHEVRHADPRLKPGTPMATVLRSATSIASDVEGLRLVLASTVGDRNVIEVPDEGSEVRLRRRM